MVAFYFAYQLGLHSFDVRQYTKWWLIDLVFSHWRVKLYNEYSTNVVNLLICVTSL